MTKLRKDYEKELQVQTALGTLGRYKVSRPFGVGSVDPELFRTKNDKWLISCEIFNAVNAEHAIDKVMEEEGFPENARKYLCAERM